MQRMVDFALENSVLLVHDNAYAELGFDGFQPPSILQANGAKQCWSTLLDDQILLHGRLALAYLVSSEVVQALAKLKSYLDYGAFQPIQIAATVTLNEDPDHPEQARPSTSPPRRPLRRAGPDRQEGGAAPGDHVRLGADPRALTGSWARSSSPPCSSRRPRPATSPGIGFGPGGDGRALRPDRERAAHRPGHPQPAPRPDQAR